MTSIEEIDTLADRATMPVAIGWEGEPRRLPTVVERGAYRVVRDALAAAEVASEATIAIRYIPGAVVVQVDDDGAGERPSLEATADFVAALGGGLKAAPVLGNASTFRVRAWLPTEGQPQSYARRQAAR